MPQLTSWLVVVFRPKQVSPNAVSKGHHHYMLGFAPHMLIEMASAEESNYRELKFCNFSNFLWIMTASFCPPVFCHHYRLITDIFDLLSFEVSFALSGRSRRFCHGWTKEKVAPSSQIASTEKSKVKDITTLLLVFDWQVITAWCSTSTQQCINERWTLKMSTEKEDIQDCVFKSCWKASQWCLVRRRRAFCLHRDLGPGQDSD